MKPLVLTAVVVSGLWPLVGCQPAVPPAAPTAGACAERPHCSFEPEASSPPDPLQAQLGCGPLYRYQNGEKGGDNGLGSFCPDSPATRKTLHDAGKHGYLPGYCQSCLGVPADKIFVFWKLFDQPSCPSTCAPGAPAL
jgi:hypothetical protein